MQEAYRGDDQRSTRTLQPFGDFTPLRWQDKEPPQRNWLVKDCFLPGTVAMISGDGAAGKSTIAQQLCTAAALGHPWLGFEMCPLDPGRKLRAFAMFCEDDEDEIHLRQTQINRYYNCDMQDIAEDVSYACRIGVENVLFRFDGRYGSVAKPTWVWDQLRRRVLDMDAQIIIIDTVADVFDGNEIMRNQVRSFINALRRLAMEVHGCVILTAHPSNAGLQSGTGISGSTAWNNSVRSRFYLTKPQGKEGEEEQPDPRLRLFKAMKNNSAAADGRWRLMWQDGVFVEQQQSTSSLHEHEMYKLAKLALELITRCCGNGDTVLASEHKSTGFLKMMQRQRWTKHVPLEGFHGPLTVSHLRSIIDHLIQTGAIDKLEIGPASKRQVILRPRSLQPTQESLL